MNKLTRLLLIPAMAFTVGGVSACNNIPAEPGSIAADARGKITSNLTEQSIGEFSKSIATNPESGAAYAGRGAVKYAAGDRKGAMADFTKAIELDSKSSAAFWGRATARYAEGDISGAISDALAAATLMASRVPANN